MSTTLAATGSALTRRSRAPEVDLDLALVESKLRRPWTRPGLVPRGGLVDRLASSPAPIIAVVAPAGYGKSTLLGQWASRSDLQPVWLSLDPQDDEPSVLLSYLLAALQRIEPIDPEVARALLAETAADASWSIRRLGALVSAVRTPFLLVLDHVEVIADPRCGDLLTALALNLPSGSRLALASRAEPPIPMTRLRSQGLVDVVGQDALTMDEREAGELLAGAGVSVEAAGVRDLVERTEGWPVGLYLASLTMRAGQEGQREQAVRGDDRLVADYLRSEVISVLEPSVLTFLTRTAVLDRLSAPLCDAVLAGGGSQQVLESLEESNLLLVPLDRRREWYRCHHLLRELLRAELTRAEPDLIPRLHDRAAAWFEANGHFDLAIDHAQAAEDPDRAARLFGQVGHMIHASGRADTTQRWLAWFEERGLMERYPYLPVLGAMAAAMRGVHAPSRLLADAAAAGDLSGDAPDGSPMRAWVAMMEACLCRNGVHRMRVDAEQALADLSLRSDFRGSAALLAGIAMLLEGEIEGADPVLAASTELDAIGGGAPTRAAALAERALVAIERGDWASGRRLSDEATAIATAAHVEGYVQSLLVHAVAARCAAHDGDVHEARARVALAARLRPRCTAAIPWSSQFLLQLAHAYIALADPAGARAVLRQVRDIVLTSRDLGVIKDQCDELARVLDTITMSSVGASSLTAAELRLLPLLATHLSYRDIGERLHVSRNTIKTEAVSVFRKLGVSSRREAVETAEKIGLMGR